jgi:hypothetical protein
MKDEKDLRKKVIEMVKSRKISPAELVGDRPLPIFTEIAEEFGARRVIATWPKKINKSELQKRFNYKGLFEELKGKERREVIEYIYKRWLELNEKE